MTSLKMATCRSEYGHLPLNSQLLRARYLAERGIELVDQLLCRGRHFGLSWPANRVLLQPLPPQPDTLIENRKLKLKVTVYGKDLFKLPAGASTNCLTGGIAISALVPPKPGGGPHSAGLAVAPAASLAFSAAAFFSTMRTAQIEPS
jgi:hypothetical protein